MPIIITAMPIILFKVKLIFGESNKPKKSITAAAISCAVRIIAMQWVTPKSLIPCITVKIIITPKAPPKKYNFLQQLKFDKFLSLIMKTIIRVIIKPIPCTIAFVNHNPIFSLSLVLNTPCKLILTPDIIAYNMPSINTSPS